MLIHNCGVFVVVYFAWWSQEQNYNFRYFNYFKIDPFIRNMKNFTCHTAVAIWLEAAISSTISRLYLNSCVVRVFSLLATFPWKSKPCFWYHFAPGSGFWGKYLRGILRARAPSANCLFLKRKILLFHRCHQDGSFQRKFGAVRLAQILKKGMISFAIISEWSSEIIIFKFIDFSCSFLFTAELTMI